MVAFFSRPKNTEKLALIIDMGSSSVGGALVMLRPGNTPKILVAERAPIVLERKLSFDRFSSLALKALEQVATDLWKSSRGRPERIFVVLSSPWYASEVRTIRLEKNTSFVFTAKLAETLMQKEAALFQEEQVEKGVEEEWQPIEFKNLKTVLNGYATNSPLGQKAKELEMHTFVSIAHANVLQKISEIIGRHFHMEAIKFTTFVLATFTVVRDMFPEQNNFLLIDIGGEVTDITLVKDNSLVQSISFPMGPNFVIRGIAEELGLSSDEAASILSLYKDGHAESKSGKKLDPIINKLKTLWLAKFQESLANLSSDISIPSSIFIAVDREFANFFSYIIKNEQFNQYTLTDSKFQITFLDAALLHRVAAFDEEVARDPFLILGSVYINRFLA